MVARGADLGLALDGDADRLLAVDHTGARRRPATSSCRCSPPTSPARGELAGNTVVVTVMTNLGFRLAMAERGIAVRETQVGDRYVLEALDADGLTLGGEQSGHIVFRELATTGDGVLTGLLLVDLVSAPRAPAGRAGGGARCSACRRCSSTWSRPAPPTRWPPPAVQAEVAAVEAELGDRGRVLLRASGTEPLVRVMVEAADEAVAHAAAERLCRVVSRALAPRWAADRGDVRAWAETP